MRKSPLRRPQRESHTRPAAGGQEPLEAILERYGQLIRKTIVNLCPTRLGLQFDDIEQEARLRLWRALQGETGIANPASYLYRIATSATLDAVRRATARREEQLRLTDELSAGEEKAATGLRHPATGPEHSPELLAERRLLIGKVEAALSRLAGERRHAVGLHMRGFTPPEIAKLLSWSEPKARSLVYRGLRELRKRLLAQGIEYEAR